MNERTLDLLRQLMENNSLEARIELAARIDRAVALEERVKQLERHFTFPVDLHLQAQVLSAKAYRQGGG